MEVQNYVVVKDVDFMLSEEVFATGMGDGEFAVVKDAQMELSTEDCAKGIMGHGGKKPSQIFETRS